VGGRERAAELLGGLCAGPGGLHPGQDQAVRLGGQHLGDVDPAGFGEPPQSARFSREESADETLMRVFKTDRSTLDAAFKAMLADLRKQLFASAHWKDIGLYQSTEEMRSDVSIIRNIVEELVHPTRPQVDLDAAREDAHAGSSELRDWPKDIEGKEIYRPELEGLLAHLKANASGTSLLIGDAGSGKSALLADLTSKLEAESLTVFALKADVIPPNVTTIDAIGAAMGMKGSLEQEIEALAKTGRVILLIDQLDAVSDVMDRSSARMQLLLRLVRQLRDKPLPIHVLVSSRPFEAAHDARFAQLKAEEFNLALPPLERVEPALSGEPTVAEVETSSSGVTVTLRRFSITRTGIDGWRSAARNSPTSWSTSMRPATLPSRPLSGAKALTNVAKLSV